MSERAPVAPYMAVGLSTIVHGVAERRHIQRNLDIIEDAIHAAVSIIGINMPVQADRAGRGRADRLHRRDLRHPPRHGPLAGGHIGGD